MKGVDYCIRKAAEYSQPVAVNISYGGTYGNHEGSSIFEMLEMTAVQHTDAVYV
ncbi:MAG: hypothetical protein ACLR7D_15540 [Lachnospira eligens]